MPRKSTRKSFDCTLPQVNCTADRKNFLPKTHEGFSLTLMAKFYLIFQEALIHQLIAQARWSGFILFFLALVISRTGIGGRITGRKSLFYFLVYFLFRFALPFMFLPVI